MPPGLNPEPSPPTPPSPSESDGPPSGPDRFGLSGGAAVPVPGTSITPNVVRPTSVAPDAATPPAAVESPLASHPESPSMGAEGATGQQGLSSAGSSWQPAATFSNAPVPPSPIVAAQGASPSGPVLPHDATKTKRFFSTKLLLIVGAVLLISGGGAAAAYFGYYMTPGTIWQQSLDNTGKGYDRLVGYLNTQSTVHYRGVKENGSFQGMSGGSNYDGSLTAQTDGGTSTSSARLDLGVTKFDLETRTIAVSGSNEPDIYLQVSGIKNLSAYLGPDLGAKVAALDGRWIVIDHNLINDLQRQLATQQPQAAQPTWADVNSFLQAASKVNRQYLFTTNKATSVTTIVKQYGKESVDGHQTYHYKVGFISAHAKAYVTAMCSALQDSTLGNYLQHETGQAVASSSTCKDLEDSAAQIKSSDTVDVWADVSHRLLYKVRMSDTTNPAQNFVDIGLNYKGGNSYPFFISGQSKDSSSSTTYSVVATLHTDTNTLDTTINATQKGASPLSLSGNFSVHPSKTNLTVTAPANAEPITDVLNSFGLGQYIAPLESPASQPILSASGNAPVLLGTADKNVGGGGSSKFLHDALSPTSITDYRKLTAALGLH